STISAGSRFLRIATALATFSASGCRTDPKLENDSIAILGSMPKVRTMRPDHLQRGTNRLRVMHADARKQRVGIATRHHHRTEVVAVEEQLMRFAVTQSFPLSALPQVVGVLVAFITRCRI